LIENENDLNIQQQKQQHSNKIISKQNILIKNTSFNSIPNAVADNAATATTVCYNEMTNKNHKSPRKLQTNEFKTNINKSENNNLCSEINSNVKYNKSPADGNLRICNNDKTKALESNKFKLTTSSSSSSSSSSSPSSVTSIQTIIEGDYIDNLCTNANIDFFVEQQRGNFHSHKFMSPENFTTNDPSMYGYDTANNLTTASPLKQNIISSPSNPSFNIYGEINETSSLTCTTSSSPFSPLSSSSLSAAANKIDDNVHNYNNILNMPSPNKYTNNNNNNNNSNQYSWSELHDIKEEICSTAPATAATTMTNQNNNWSFSCNNLSENEEINYCDTGQTSLDEVKSVVCGKNPFIRNYESPYEWSHNKKLATHTGDVNFNLSATADVQNVEYYNQYSEDEFNYLARTESVVDFGDYFMHKQVGEKREQVLTPEIMKSLHSFLEQHGNDYIKQFVQVICKKEKYMYIHF
jgi:hypothetical protein